MLIRDATTSKADDDGEDEEDVEDGEALGICSKKKELKKCKKNCQGFQNAFLAKLTGMPNGGQQCNRNSFILCVFHNFINIFVMHVLYLLVDDDYFSCMK